ncbi:unnamed protein product [Penicillium salamii]|nr:unnamed protein product [Penicillium salamii]CAG8275906.1 unnamed protein product [Penicillium salamii]CAG8363835.1 unnamed protein product [Penicillium salamii]
MGPTQESEHIPLREFSHRSASSNRFNQPHEGQSPELTEQTSSSTPIISETSHLEASSVPLVESDSDDQENVY